MLEISRIICNILEDKIVVIIFLVFHIFNIYSLERNKRCIVDLILLVFGIISDVKIISANLYLS
jgi:hypothetical protein